MTNILTSNLVWNLLWFLNRVLFFSFAFDLILLCLWNTMHVVLPTYILSLVIFSSRESSVQHLLNGWSNQRRVYSFSVKGYLVLFGVLTVSASYSSRYLFFSTLQPYMTFIIYFSIVIYISKLYARHIKPKQKRSFIHISTA